MPCDKSKGGRPSKTQYLEGFLPDIKRMAFFGYTVTEIAETIGDVCSETVRKFMQGRELKIDERLQPKHIAVNCTPENIATVKVVYDRHVLKWQKKYGVIRDGKNGRRYTTNKHKVSDSTIEAKGNVLFAKVLNNYHPRMGPIGPYAEKAFKLSMNDVARDGYADAKTMNLSNVSANDESALDKISGKEIGLENMLAVDMHGNEIGLMAGKGFGAMVLESSWQAASHTNDKRIFHCFGCHVDYAPKWIAKPSKLSAPDGWPERYACPVCGSAYVSFTGMKVVGPHSSVNGQKKARETWEGFLVPPYNIIEGITSTSQLNTPGTVPNSNHTIRQMEGKKHDAIGKVCAGEIGVARRVRWQGAVYCARKLLRSFAEPDHTSIERLRKLPHAPGKQVQPVSHGVTS